MVMYAEECDGDYSYDDKEYYSNQVPNSSNDFEEQDDDQTGWISSPTTSLLLSKIYFGQNL